MSLEDRLRRIVTALPEQASVTLPVRVVKEWLEVDAEDPLADLTAADVALQLGRSPGTVRDWIRRGELEAYRLGKEYRVTRAALTTFCQRQRNGPRTSDRSEAACELRAHRQQRLRDYLTITSIRIRPPPEPRSPPYGSSALPTTAPNARSGLAARIATPGVSDATSKSPGRIAPPSALTRT